MDFGPALAGALDKQACGAWRIKHAILRHQQAAGHAFPQIRFQRFQRSRIEYFSGNSAIAIVVVLASAPPPSLLRRPLPKSFRTVRIRHPG